MTTEDGDQTIVGIQGDKIVIHLPFKTGHATLKLTNDDARALAGQLTLLADALVVKK